ncbi:Uncharacterised protein [Dermacoccus nishinomiyaensis]|uniref:hypothetical protein n=1 Tax=Dermacoccus nishinomiyaensis TaxID=1274 RepID=UPI000DFA3280|nr:hypothetical protein [Dermacoccus nishinomiyaensis]STD20289.1 Uncharacterised protein [Dermacoccus nishinomiyaensis]
MTATRPAPLTLDQADVLVAAMSDTPLSTAIRVLIATWRERASAGDMSPQTVDKFTLLMGDSTATPTRRAPSFAPTSPPTS